MDDGCLSGGRRGGGSTHHLGPLSTPWIGAAVGWGLLGASALMFGLALGPAWLQKAISIATAAYGIYQQRPGIIQNFTNGGGANFGNRPGLASIGAITFFLQQNQAPQRDPACTRVNALLDASGQGYYTYGPQNQRYGQPGMVAALQNFASDWNVNHPGNPIGIGDLANSRGPQF